MKDLKADPEESCIEIFQNPAYREYDVLELNAHIEECIRVPLGYDGFFIDSYGVKMGTEKGGSKSDNIFMSTNKITYIETEESKVLTIYPIVLKFPESKLTPKVYFINHEWHGKISTNDTNYDLYHFFSASRHFTASFTSSLAKDLVYSGVKNSYGCANTGEELIPPCQPSISSVSDLIIVAYQALGSIDANLEYPNAPDGYQKSVSEVYDTTLELEPNRLYEAPPHPSPETDSKTIIIIVVVVVVVVIILIALIYCCCCRKKPSDTLSSSSS